MRSIISFQNWLILIRNLTSHCKCGEREAYITVNSGGLHAVKLARAKLPTSTGISTCSSQVKRPHTQFKCVTCSLPVKTGKFTCFFAVSTSSRIHANCLKPQQIYLHTTGILQAILHAELMQFCPRLVCKLAYFCRQKYMQFAGKNTRIAGKKTRQTQAKLPA